MFLLSEIHCVIANLHELKARCPFTRFNSSSTALDGFQLHVFWLYVNRSSSVCSVTRLRALPGSRGFVPNKDIGFSFLPSWYCRHRYIFFITIVIIAIIAVVIGCVPTNRFESSRVKSSPARLTKTQQSLCCLLTRAAAAVRKLQQSAGSRTLMPHVSFSSLVL
jgi:hypothetical protein